ncbi:Uncharacterised protein [Mobiluncus curtisii]|uniref:Uncharacterized protein n=1 Tax=Mobiluncus curtisii TaxID=2051 RepID=A0A2X3DS96_9ACTO|nr:Uncharacterised protein [Mobiluncus curtisii]
MRCGMPERSSQDDKSGPRPRRGGFTTTKSGGISVWLTAHLVASAVMKCGRGAALGVLGVPSFLLLGSTGTVAVALASSVTACFAPSIAGPTTSTPVTCATPAELRAKAKPPTPQYKSQAVSGWSFRAQGSLCIQGLRSCGICLKERSWC